MVWLRDKLDLVLILVVITSIISKSTSNRYVNTTLNITSSDNKRLKIISVDIDQNAAVNVTYELMQSWDHILLNFSIFCKTSGSDKTRKLSGIDNLDYCSTAENVNSVKNPFIRNLFQSIRARQPNSMKKCPLMGVTSSMNSPEPQNLLNNIMPLGKYVIKSRMYDQPSGAKQLRLDTLVTFTLVAD